MAYDSPFGTKRSVSTPQDENSHRFAKLKPVCVELLGRISPKSSIEATYTSLKKLHDVLSGLFAISPDRVPLSLSLINYVFFPLAQLLRASPKGEADLPDRVRQVVFQILALLATDWWQLWTDNMSLKADAPDKAEQWKVWEQLLILGAVALGAPLNGKTKAQTNSSEETQMAVSTFLQELLLPRLATSPNRTSSLESEWEWDGEEELPSLDDFDQFQAPKTQSRNKGRMHDVTGETSQIYPSSAHLQHNYQNAACRGAIAHALTASLDVASDINASSTVRISCLEISRIVVCYWMAGNDTDEKQPKSLWRKVRADGTNMQIHRPDSNAVFSPTSQADRVAVFFPGYVSSMVRILTSTISKTRAEVISQALLSLDDILQICLGDSAIEDIISSSLIDRSISPQPASIDELVARTVINGDTPVSPTVTADEKYGQEEEKKLHPTGRNKAWLLSTVSHIIIALQSLDSLSNHGHPQVQAALVSLADNTLTHCHLMLQVQEMALKSVKRNAQESIDATRLLLRWVVDACASKSSSTITATRAEGSLRFLITVGKGRERCHEAINEEILDAIRSIPRLLGSQKAEELEKVARRLAFLLHLASCGFDSSINVMQGLRLLLQASSGVERWGPSLLWSIKLDDQPSIEQGLGSFILQGLSPASSKAIMGIFEELGRATARVIRQDCYSDAEIGMPFHLVWYFMDQATSHRSTLMTRSSSVQHSRQYCQSALMVVDGMMKGIGEILDDELLAIQTSKSSKKLRRIAHRLAKEMLRRVTELWEEDEEELLETDLSQRRTELSNEERQLITQTQQEVSLTEYSKGVGGQENAIFERPNGFGPALQLDFVSSASLLGKGAVKQTIQTDQQVQRTAKAQLDRSDAILLSILSSTCKILGPSLKPSLLRMLYPIICGIASQSSLVSGTAADTMNAMARSAGYASIQGCVSDHADYVLGTASHRLISTLGQELQAISIREAEGASAIHIPLISAQSAPLVLVEIIRMLGGEALTLIEDAIDEVLEAIDRFHLQANICDNLLTVLDRLVEVMVSDERRKVKEEKTSNDKMINASTIAFQPNVERDMEKLQTWFQSRRTSQSQQEAGRPEESLGTVLEKTEESQDEQSEKATPSQLVVVSILEKAVPFLSHSSARIRIRCLRLLNRGIELLCLQKRTVEPLQVINNAWPAIMSRLGFTLSLSLRRFDKVDVPAYEDLSEKDFYTCNEAAKLVTTLAKFLVDYLGSEKMLRQAVPRLLLLLKIVERGEGREGVEKLANQRTFLLKELPSSTTIISPSSTTRPLTKFQPIKSHTPLYTMVQTVLSLLDTLVNAMGPQVTEADLYQFATHHTLLSCLDRRQEAELQRIATHFYLSTLSKRNENLVWLVLGGAKDKEDYFPAFLHHPHLALDNL